ncbi:MAG: hypothetical protein ACK5GN_03120, partial [Pseudomonadota bacterium]
MLLFRRLDTLQHQADLCFRGSHRSLLAVSMALAFFLALIIFTPISDAQTRLLGRAADGNLVGYAVYQKGGAVRVESIGNLEPSQNVGHLYGRFLRSQDKTLLKVRRVSALQFTIEATDSRGVQITRNLTLEKPIGNYFYALTGFNHGGASFDDLALIGLNRTGNRLMWQIVHDPLSKSPRVNAFFRLGFYGDRPDFTRSPNGELLFTAVRQTYDTERIRAQFYAPHSGQRTILRARWPGLQGLLTPLRLSSSNDKHYGIALYSP